MSAFYHQDVVSNKIISYPCQLYLLTTDVWIAETWNRNKMQHYFQLKHENVLLKTYLLTWTLLK